MSAHPAADPDRSVVENARPPLARLADPPDLPLPEVFRRACEAAAETLRVERAGVWLFVNTDKSLRCVSLFERSKRRHSKGACLPLADFPTFLRAISAAPLLPCEAARADPRTAELRDTYLVPFGITSVLDVPLLRDGRVVGMACLEHVGPAREWADDDRAFALELADFLTGRMRVAEGVLRTTGQRPSHAVPPPAPRQPAAGGAAHDLRNVFNQILAHAELLARLPGLPTGVADRAVRIADAVHEGVALVRALFDPAAAEHDSVNVAQDDTGEHAPLPPDAPG